MPVRRKDNLTPPEVKTRTFYLRAHVSERNHQDMLDFIRTHLYEGANLSTVTEAALTAFLNPSDPMPSIFRALRRLDNHMVSTEDRLDMFGHFFLHFLRYFFVLWPYIPSELQTEKHLRSRQMVVKFLRSLRRGFDTEAIYHLLDPEKIEVAINELMETITESLTRQFNGDEGEDADV